MPLKIMKGCILQIYKAVTVFVLVSTLLVCLPPFVFAHFYKSLHCFSIFLKCKEEVGSIICLSPFAL